MSSIRDHPFSEIGPEPFGLTKSILASSRLLPKTLYNKALVAINLYFNPNFEYRFLKSTLVKAETNVPIGVIGY